MQTQVIDTSPRRAADIDTKLASAHAEHTKLVQAATDAKAQADRWRVTFKREPTPQAHSSFVVAEQEAENAQTAADEFERDVMKPLEKAQRQAERDATGAARAREASKAVEGFTRAAEQFRDAAHTLDAAVLQLAGLHESRLAAAQQGVRLQPISLANIIDELNQKLKSALPAAAHELPAKFVDMSFIDDGRDARIVFTVHRPASAVPTPLR
ncbi:MAG TPA: hypothetical protein VGJ84_21875 [Polyangiaceae bacterium]|jgi:hypothetical protein